MHSLLKSREKVHLFLVGDIFDLWVGDHQYFQDEFIGIVETLRQLRFEKGFEIYYFEGNHDLHLQEFWQNQMKFNVYTTLQRFEIDGLKLVVEHGDEINREDRGYLFLRWLLRSKLMTWAAYRLPSSWIKKIGRESAKASRSYTSEVKTLSQEVLIEKLHAHARQLYREKEFDFHIHGHVHLRDEFFLESKAQSINLGTWLDQPGFLEIETESQKAHWIGL